MTSQSRCRQIKWHTSNQQGFTLIEMLIVAAIVVIAAGMSVPNLLSYRSKYQFNRAVNDIYSNLQWARLTAIRESTPCRVVFDKVNDSYAIILNPNSTVSSRLRSIALSEYNSAISLTPSGADNITYNPRGTGSSGTVVVAMPYSYCEEEEDCCVCITVSSSGRVTKAYPKKKRECQKKCP